MWVRDVGSVIGSTKSAEAALQENFELYHSAPLIISSTRPSRILFLARQFD